MKIFVGNLSFDATEADVRKLFEGFGSVASVVIVMDKKGRNSRGFGFLDMPDDEQAKQAVARLNQQEFMGRPLNLEEARPKPQNAPEGSRGQRPRSLSGKEFPLQPQGAAGYQWGRRPGRPGFDSGSRYKQGRRTKSFMRRRAEAGIEGPLPERKAHDNPMRWRKKKPWQKNRPSFASKPHEGSQRSSASSEKPQGHLKPWQKSSARPKKAGFHKRKKFGAFKR